jgi:lipoyl-dependent peroxiredoxin
LSFRVVRTAEASWQGAVPEGSGRIALGSGAFDGPYSLRSRVEEGMRATNPEELVGAAKDCTVSRALTGTEITLQASVAGG